jgi:hypothetical protein
MKKYLPLVFTSLFFVAGTEGVDAGRQLTIKRPRTQETSVARPYTVVIGATIGNA